MKINRHGKSAIISDDDYSRLLKQIRSKKYKLLLSIARYTGERWGAIVQLRIEDIFDINGNPKEWITFRGSTRKASAGIKAETRQVPVHPILKEILEAYQPPKEGWLFESRIHEGKHITLRAADRLFRRAVESAGLSHKGYSTHSTRRTFITRLSEKGVDLRTIQIITGHKDLKTLVGYVESDPKRIAKALAIL